MPKNIAREDHCVLVTIGCLEKYPNMGVLDAIDGEDNDNSGDNNDGKDNKYKTITKRGSGRNGGDDGNGDGDSNENNRRGQ